MEPINLFIGSSSNHEDNPIEIAYRYSLEKNRNKNRPLNIHWMRQTNDPSSFWYGFQTQNWSTPFSGFRWAIPEFMNFKGIAIYTDVDMINLRDIGDLADEFMYDRPVLARRGHRFGGHEFCVMVIDCNKMKNEVIPVVRQKNNPEYHHRMIAKFSGNPDLTADLDPRWNCLDGENLNLNQIWQLHFTNMATQPWRPAWYKGPQLEHPRPDVVKLFQDTYQAAIAEGWSQLYTKPEPPINYNIIGK